MTNYFRVQEIPQNKKRKNKILQWISNLSITGKLILANVVLFFIFALLGVLSGNDCASTNCNYVALQPLNLFQNFYIWTLLTSIFMHSGPIHLIVNMLSLFFIGSFLEMIIGKKRFFWLYIFAGIFAGLFFAALSWFFGASDLGAKIFGSSDTFAVGASGAIFAIAGVLAFLTPRNKVYLLVGPLIAIIVGAVIPSMNFSYSGLIQIILNIYIFISILSMFSINPFFRKLSIPCGMPFWLLPIVAIVPLVLIGMIPGINLPIGNTAHLGGFIFGALYGLYLRVKYKKKTQKISDYFSK